MRFGLKFILAKKRTKSLKLLFTAKQNSFDPCFVAALVLFNCSSGKRGGNMRSSRLCSSSWTFVYFVCFTGGNILQSLLVQEELNKKKVKSVGSLQCICLRS